MDEIDTTITSYNQHLTAVYDKIAAKGGTVPANKNMANLAPSILSIAGTDPVFDTEPSDLSLNLANRISKMHDHLRLAYQAVTASGGV